MVVPGVLHGVSWDFRGVPGGLRWIHGRSMGFQDVSGAFQSRSRNVPVGVSCFNGRSIGFQGLSRGPTVFYFADLVHFFNNVSTVHFCDIVSSEKFLH